MQGAWGEKEPPQQQPPQSNQQLQANVRQPVAEPRPKVRCTHLDLLETMKTGFGTRMGAVSRNPFANVLRDTYCTSVASSSSLVTLV